MVMDITDIYAWERSPQDPHGDDKDDEFGNKDAESLITMERKGTGYLYLREINSHVILTCIMGEESPADSKAVVDFNVGMFQRAVNEILLWK